MPTLISTHSGPLSGFLESVIEPFKVPLKGSEYSYLDYLTLPPNLRSGDEADVVDLRFTQAVLEWLGFHKSEGHYQYNRASTILGGSSLRPDFEVFGAVGIAFIWEDKNTTEEFDEGHSLQLRKYVAGTSSYAVWCNARQIIGFRFDARGQHQRLVEVDVESLASNSFIDERAKKNQEAALELFRLLFSRQRFTAFESLLDSICVDENIFLDQADPLTGAGAQSAFVSGARQILEHLRLAALQRILPALSQQRDVLNREESLRREWNEAKHELQNLLSQAIVAEQRESLSNLIEEIAPRLGELTEQELAVGRFQRQCTTGARRLSVPDKTVLEQWVLKAKSINAAFRQMRLTSVEERHIKDAFQVWSDRQPLIDLDSPEIFAEQVAYVVFVRLLLARVLEDKHLIRQRIASDGGFKAWRDVVARYFGANGGKIHADSFMSLLSESLSKYYHHFFQQPVFDWFVPDDFMLLETLEFLSRYNFQDVESDLLGFTYEEYIDRVARNKKGHFLTRPEVVDYMLDLAGYRGPNIIGQRFLDPACGSGSFLVQALRRYREAVILAICRRDAVDRDQVLARQSTREEVARETIKASTGLFFGMDIDPFACYLAELNLLIQNLEDMHYLCEVVPKI
jgi:hypothetical protein